MGTAVHLESATVDALDRMVAIGRFGSRDEAIRTALHIVEEQDAAELGPLGAEEIAGIERGLADAEAGRLIPLEIVRANMKRRFAPSA